MVNPPPFFGTDKGKIIESIALSYCFDFWEIQTYTNIENNILYEEIGKLMDEGYIYRWKNQFRVEKNTYIEWKEYYDNKIQEKLCEGDTEIVQKENIDICTWIERFIDFKKEYNEIDIPIINNHLYLEGYILQEFLTGLILQTSETIRVVSPWTENVTLTQLLCKIGADDKQVTLITREPKLESDFKYERSRAEVYEECHKRLEEKQVKVLYSNEVHGKVIIVDDKVAVVSSVNFQEKPMSGLSWEAGIITIEEEIIKKINESLDNIPVTPRVL